MTETSHRSLANFVEHDAQSPLNWVSKPVSERWSGLSARALDKEGLFAAGTPVMTVDKPALEHNITEMARWCEINGVHLAPHGKTTMAPALWLAQLEAGAWGITIANEAQLRVAHGVGVPRVQLANMLIRPEAVRWLSRALDENDAFQAYSWVDSIDAVAAMDAALSGVEHRRPLTVFVEIGAPGARTGARTQDAAREVARAVLASQHLALAGVSGYEGVLSHGTSEADIALIDGFLGRIRDLHDELLPSYEVDEVVLTAGGSAYFDRVLSVLKDCVRGTAEGKSVKLVLRSGAYVVHDDGICAELTPSQTRTGPVFRAASNVWARVLSIPEPTIAYLDAGRRDLPADEGWPVVLDARREHGAAVDILAIPGHAVTGMNDQHVHVALPAGSPLRVGDIVRLGVSHPCTVFDKWTHIVVVDDATAAEPRLVDIIRTYF